MIKPYRILSFGAGVQSTTLWRMIQRGEFEHPDAVIFADTGWEMAATIEHTRVCQSEAEAIGISFYFVGKGNIRADLLQSAARAHVGDVDEDTGEERRFASLPLYTRDPVTRDVGTLRRQCTGEYKLDPINRKARELIGIGPKQRAPIGAVEMWICITTDELSRVSVSRDRWRVNRYPFVELRMRRSDCIAYMERNGDAIPPRSACIGCPFRSNSEWRAVQEDPAAWSDACSVDDAIRQRGGIRGELFLHRSAIPLRMVDLTTPEDHGQQSMFGAECLGMCGL